MPQGKRDWARAPCQRSRLDSRSVARGSAARGSRSE